jgi:hypothetical protein
LIGSKIIYFACKEREYLPMRSSTISDFAFDECKLLNYANFQAQLTGNNINDLHRELFKAMKDAESHKEEIIVISEKIEILTHVLTETSELKNFMAKVESRLDLMDTLLHKINEVKKNSQNLLEIPTM